jgi:mannose-6-phosphate isomerase-like protein (cupin superfamily)
MAASPSGADERTIDPTWLYRNSDSAPALSSDITTADCRYKPLFGAGDKDNGAEYMGSIARFGEAVVSGGGSCAPVTRAKEDTIYYVRKGNGTAQYNGQSVIMKEGDFLYVPATVSASLQGAAGAGFTVVVMGFHTDGFKTDPLPEHPLKANLADVPLQHVGRHPDSTLYRLMLGDSAQSRDKIDAGRVVTSLFLMEIDAGGTNFPHHHPNAEEIYLVLDGHGSEVVGGGVDGIAGKIPAKAGDAFFYRLNATVGYYSAPGTKSRILCVRSFHPAAQ